MAPLQSSILSFGNKKLTNMDLNSTTDVHQFPSVKFF